LEKEYSVQEEETAGSITKELIAKKRPAVSQREQLDNGEQPEILSKIVGKGGQLVTDRDS
jgi:hypothetical protein